MRPSGGNTRHALLALMATTLLLAACSEVDCPLSNNVYARYAMKGDTLRDTLTIITLRPDSGDAVMLNRLIGADHFFLPVSYNNDADQLLFLYTDTTGTERRDTITMSKTNQKQFEGIDCPPTFFHTVTEMKHTRHRIDSIVIRDPNIDNNETKEHFYIYFNSTR
ncbi:DUF6452 family protein [Prevotella brunnea]|uniref:DUF6452 family protein n=1 Tax=Prevotella brunnea TaxID=2508867 RepID=UPI001F00A1CD|nr:DUF6452 family protein [Prevotella brunnea]